MAPPGRYGARSALARRSEGDRRRVGDQHIDDPGLQGVQHGDRAGGVHPVAWPDLRIPFAEHAIEGGPWDQALQRASPGIDIGDGSGKPLGDRRAALEPISTANRAIELQRERND